MHGGSKHQIQDNNNPEKKEKQMELGLILRRTSVLIGKAKKKKKTLEASLAKP